jgi:GTP cyclohydrolase II
MSRPAIRTKVTIPIRGGYVPEFVSFDNMGTNAEHVALLFEGWDHVNAPLCRVHSACLSGDVFGSRRCDCGAQLSEAIQRLGEAGGVLLYLEQEGRGIGLYNKLDAYRLQIEEGADTFHANDRLGFAADQRDFSVAAGMLKALGIDRVRLLTNNPEKANQLKACHIRVAEQIATQAHVTDENRSYLATKRAHGHYLPDTTRDES